jgi:hypothetical protein
MVPTTYQGQREVLFQAQRWVSRHCQCLHCEMFHNRNLMLHFPSGLWAFLRALPRWTALASLQGPCPKLCSVNSCEASRVLTRDLPEEQYLLVALFGTGQGVVRFSSEDIGNWALCPFWVLC